MMPAKSQATITVKYFFFLFLFILLSIQTEEAQKIINEYARVVNIFNTDSTDVDSIEVNNLVFEKGDTVLFIVMKGATVYMPWDGSALAGNIANWRNSGIYNILLVYEVQGNMIIFTTKLRTLVKTEPGEVAQLVKISGGRNIYRVDEPLTCKQWDPADGTGGVFALIAGRKIVLNSTIDVSGKGFQGGNPDAPVTDYFKGNCSEAADGFYTGSAVDSAGRKGESVVYEGFQFTRGMLYTAHGGGGGNGKYSGGGGGGDEVTDVDFEEVKDDKK